MLGMIFETETRLLAGCLTRLRLRLRRHLDIMSRRGVFWMLALRWTRGGWPLWNQGPWVASAPEEQVGRLGDYLPVSVTRDQGWEEFGSYRP